MNWPSDADGDVLRRLQGSGFDFDLEHDVEFMVDFESWPPKQEVIDVLNKQYGNIEVYPPESDSEGYLLFTITRKLTYEFVINTQHETSQLAKEYGGVCEAWGLLHG